MGIEIGSFKFVRHTDVSARIFYIGAHRAGSPVVCFTIIRRPTQYGRKRVGSQMSLVGRQNLSRIQNFKPIVPESSKYFCSCYYFIHIHCPLLFWDSDSNVI